jgi:hypothetical protein
MVNLTNVDTRFSQDLTTQQADRIFVRLGFTNAGTPQFDNVRIEASLVPEPTTAVLLLAGLLGLGRAGRKRA